MAYYKILQKNLRESSGNLWLNLFNSGIEVEPPWGTLPDTAMSAELWDNSVSTLQPWEEDAFITVKCNIGGVTQFITVNSSTIWSAKLQIENAYPEQLINFSSFTFIAWNQKVF